MSSPYFNNLAKLLSLEKEEDRRSWEALTRSVPLNERRANGTAWFPVVLRDSEAGYGDYLTIEVERTSNQEVIHQFRFGASVALFSNHNAGEDRLEGVVNHVRADRMRISLRVDELPDWVHDGKLGVDLVFDVNSYEEMERALRIAPERIELKEEGALTRVLTGLQEPSFDMHRQVNPLPRLNEKQNEAVAKIITAQELAIVHGPPGTGKTTTLVAAIAMMARREGGPILVTAPSNAAVDLLSEKLAAEGLNVVRVGNPARVSEQQLSLTLDERMAAHPQMKEIRRMRKQASEYRDLAKKYKRSFGAAEREQRKALFNEARAIGKEIERTEAYITSSILDGAQVITATLVGAAHYSVRGLKYETVVIDEAGQALEPACWIPILKGKKLVMAGDHCQLPPTIRSQEAERAGLGRTLMERSVGRYPQTVVLLEEQYRMHEDIMRFSSKEFYEGKLKAAPAVAGHLLFEGDRPFTFIDTAGCGYEEKPEGKRLSNPEEGRFLLQQVRRLLQALPAEAARPRIGVIAPYRHQVELLREAAAEQFPEARDIIAVNTIDSFQGQERDAIFISLVRSNSDNVIGFLSEVRRMNVAMTRAKKKLVLVGDSATLSQYPFYADLIAYAQEIEGYVSAWELMDF